MHIKNFKENKSIAMRVIELIYRTKQRFSDRERKKGGVNEHQFLNFFLAFFCIFFVSVNPEEGKFTSFSWGEARRGCWGEHLRTRS